MILYTLYINVEKSYDICIYLYKEKKRLTHKLINECASLCYQLRLTVSFLSISIYINSIDLFSFT